MRIKRNGCLNLSFPNQQLLLGNEYVFGLSQGYL